MRKRTYKRNRINRLTGESKKEFKRVLTELRRKNDNSFSNSVLRQFAYNAVRVAKNG